MSKTRVIIENVIGIMKAMWTVLKNCKSPTEEVPKIVMGLGVLHNIIHSFKGFDD